MASPVGGYCSLAQAGQDGLIAPPEGEFGDLKLPAVDVEMTDSIVPRKMCRIAPIRSAAIDSSVFGRAAFCCQAMKWRTVSNKSKIGSECDVVVNLGYLFIGGARSKELGGTGGAPGREGKE